MENDFRTTFIPKKPIVPQAAPTSAPVSKPVGILFVLAVIIFIASLAIAAGTYFYKSYQSKQVADLAVSLDKVQKSLDANVIKEFSIMDKRLRNAETLLSQHNVTYPLFDALRTTTLPAVRYTKMDFAFNDAGGLDVTMSGESDGYRSIALQSQALTQNTDLSGIIFSNFIVTPKGRVSFDVSFAIPKGDLAFSKNLGQLSGLNTQNDSTLENTPGDTAEPEATVTEEVTTEAPASN
jgi:hypothetical protein